MMLVYSDSHLKLILVLIAALVTLTYAYVSIRRFFVRRQFAHAHGCQKVGVFSWSNSICS